MKALKIVLIIVGILVVGGIALVALALTPAVQTWAVRRAVSGQPGAEIQVGRVAAGLSSANVTGLRVVANGTEIEVGSVTASYSLVGLASGAVHLGSVEVKDLLVDARGAAGTAGTPRSAPPPTPQAAAPRPRAGGGGNGGIPSLALPDFNGLLAQARLPMDLQVDRLAVNGKVLLPANRDVALEVTAADIGTGKDGRLDWKVDLTDATAAAPVRAVHASGNLTLAITADRGVSQVALAVQASAEGPNLPADRLNARLAAGTTGADGDESYSLNVELERAGGPEPIIDSTVAFHRATKTLEGTWKVSARSEQFADLFAGLGLPALAADGNGSFSFAAETGDLTASGGLNVQASDLERISAGLAAMGSARSQADFGLRITGGTATLERLQLNLAAGDGRQLAAVNLQQQVSVGLADLRVALADPASELARVSIQNFPVAWLQPWVGPISLESGEVSMVLAVDAEADGQRVHLRTVNPLQVRDLTVRQGGKSLVDGATFSVSPDIDYTAARIQAALNGLSVALPAGDNIAGTVTANVTGMQTTPAVDFTVQLKGALGEGFRSQFPEMPTAVSFDAGVEGRLEGSAMSVASYRLVVNEANGGLLASIEALQPFRVDLDQGTYVSSQPDAPAWRIRLGEVPLAWAAPFVEDSQFAGTLTGGTVEVTVRNPDDISATTSDALAVRAATISLQGADLVRSLDLSADLEGSRSGDVYAFDLRRIEARQGDNLLLRFQGSGNVNPGAVLTGAAKGTLDIPDVGALLQQPVLASAAGLRRGSLNATFDANVGDAIQASFTLTGRNLTPTQADAAPADLDISGNVSRKTDGTGTVRLPVVLTAADRRSDLLVEGSFGQPAGGITFNGRISGQQINVDDFTALVAFAPSGNGGATTPSRPATTPATAPTAASPSTGPLWKGVTGRVDLDLKQVRSAGYELNGLQGALTVTDQKISLEGLQGRFGDSNPFKLSGNLNYVANQARHYVADGNVDLQGLDVGRILQQANPSDKPAIETTVTIQGNVAGSAAELEALPERLTGQFSLTGTKGILRALGRKGEAVGVLSAAAGLIGALRGSDTTVATAQLASILAEAPFDKFTLKVDRGADLNLKLSSLEFVSPAMHLTGSGSVTYEQGVPINQQPLNLQLQLSGKDQLAQVLNRLGMLESTADAQGYYPMSRPFVLGGTIAKPDSSQFWAMLAGAAASSLLGR